MYMCKKCIMIKLKKIKNTVYSKVLRHTVSTKEKVEKGEFSVSWHC